jgi:Asp-tRNA(Asn)/Glu-tRNA(Gln) amidotransferase A subunit family amidase
MRRRPGLHGESMEPQDHLVDRRAFLKRAAALGAGGVGGALGALPALGLSREAPAGSQSETRPAAFPDDGAAPRSILGRVTDPAALTAMEAGTLFRSGDLAPSELIEACLGRISNWDRVYMAFNAILEDEALDRARELDGRVPVDLLHGIPVALKDNIHVSGHPTTANSRLFEGFLPEHDATLVQRLRDGGAVLLGKTQMGPLATTRALTPEGRITTVNAWAPGTPSISPGGSSSGSATAVAAQLATIAVGTQTGGSITTPALAQGLTGLKPTLGRVSVEGIIPLSHTRDHPGPIARDARDAALLLQAMAGPDPMDPRTLGLPPVPDYIAAAAPVARGSRVGLRWPTRVGVPAEWREAEDPRVGRDRDRFLNELSELGAQLVPLSEPEGWEDLASPAVNGARLAERSELFLAELQDDVRSFGVALSPWINGLLLSGDQYLRAQKARTALLAVVLDEIFSLCDVVLQVESRPFDLIGLPLLALPVGMRRVNGVSVPHGALLGGAPFGEERLLSIAAAWQAVSDWHLARPEPFEGAGVIGPAGGGSDRGRLGVEEVARQAE